MNDEYGQYIPERHYLNAGIPDVEPMSKWRKPSVEYHRAPPPGEPTPLFAPTDPQAREQARIAAMDDLEYALYLRRMKNDMTPRNPAGMLGAVGAMGQGVGGPQRALAGAVDAWRTGGDVGQGAYAGAEAIDESDPGYRSMGDAIGIPRTSPNDSWLQYLAKGAPRLTADMLLDPMNAAMTGGAGPIARRLGRFLK